MRLSKWIEPKVSMPAPAPKPKAARPRQGVTIGGKSGRRPKVRQKNYDVGDQAYYFTGGLTSNQQIFHALSALRRICRAQYQRNDYAKAAVRIVRQAVMGTGVKLRLDGLEINLEETVMAEWREWTRKSNMTAAGQSSLDQIAGLAINALMMDGEFIASIGGKYPMQLWESPRLDHTLNDERTNTIMGIEHDPDGRPSAYCLREDSGALSLYSSMDVGRILKVPAKAFLHLFNQEFAEQIRGVPILATACARLDDINEYTRAELSASMLAAKKQIFIKENEEGQGLGSTYYDDEPPEDGEEDKDQPVVDADGEELLQLAYGAEVVNWDPNHPTSNHGGFVDKNVESVAAGVGTNSFDLGNNYSRVNFSAGRLARLTSIDNYKMLQELLIEGLYDRVFADFVFAASLDGKFGATPPLRIIDAHKFVPRSFDHVQPREQATANDIGLKNGTKTMRDIIEESGADWDEHVRQLRLEAELRQELALGGGEAQPTLEVIGGEG